MRVIGKHLPRIRWHGMIMSWRQWTFRFHNANELVSNVTLLRRTWNQKQNPCYIFMQLFKIFKFPLSRLQNQTPLRCSSKVVWFNSGPNRCSTDAPSELLQLWTGHSMIYSTATLCSFIIYRLWKWRRRLDKNEIWIQTYFIGHM